jgi:asparagine synthase (glutamine-hydrolysing)
MLLRKFPAYYLKIPWQRTGAPIAWPRFAARMNAAARRLKNRLAGGTVNYADYPGWIREGPARKFFARVLGGRAALYPAYVPRRQVLDDLERHFKGADLADRLCRYMTFELWLQQAFNNRFRDSRAEEFAAALR